MSIPAVPSSLSGLSSYLVHGSQLEKHDPLMSYHCRYYAVQEGIKRRAANPDEPSKKFLISLMDQLEKQKMTLGAKLDDPANGQPYATTFVQRVFNLADNEDRAGKATKNTAKNFLAASQFIDVLKQFGELSQDMIDKQKYAKWKAADISAALKRGETPKPGNWKVEVESGEEELEEESTSKENSNADVSSNFQQEQSQIFNNQLNFNPPQSPSFPVKPDTPYIPPATNNFYVPMPTVPVPNVPAPIPTPSFVQIPEPQKQPVLSPPVSTARQSTRTPTDEDKILAAKYAKFVVSSLDYDDVNSAVKYLRMALKQLTGSE